MKLIFAGYTGSKNPVQNRLKIQFVEHDFPTWFFKNRVQMDNAYDLICSGIHLWNSANTHKYFIWGHAILRGNLLNGEIASKTVTQDILFPACLKYLKLYSLLILVVHNTYLHTNTRLWCSENYQIQRWWITDLFK